MYKEDQEHTTTGNQDDKNNPKIQRKRSSGLLNVQKSTAIRKGLSPSLRRKNKPELTRSDSLKRRQGISD